MLLKTEGFVREIPDKEGVGGRSSIRPGRRTGPIFYGAGSALLQRLCGQQTHLYAVTNHITAGAKPELLSNA
jgi:hypothetical protein